MVIKHLREYVDMTSGVLNYELPKPITMSTDRVLSQARKGVYFVLLNTSFVEEPWNVHYLVFMVVKELRKDSVE